MKIDISPATFLWILFGIAIGMLLGYFLNTVTSSSSGSRKRREFNNDGLLTRSDDYYPVRKGADTYGAV